jgi:peptidoglycan/LPS O-acetylase OafA/YrhL
MISHTVYVGNEFGNTAMIGFYMLSGYSITARGMVGDFWIGRFLRLWPCYIVVAALTQTALILGWVPGQGMPLVGLAVGWDAIAQFSMIFHPDPQSLVPPAWMLKWLLLGYLLMWLGTSKTSRRSAVWMLLSFVASTFWLARMGSYQSYYVTWLCASLATSVGACCHHLDLIAPRDGRWAAFAGTLSYPLFLAHYGIGSAVSSITGWDPSWPLFWASLPPTIALSIALVLLVERPIARYRKHTR